MITIRPIREEDIPAAKRVILSVAYNIFGFDGTLEDSLRHFLAAGKLKDMDDLQGNYFNAGGTFLVALNGEQVIGSGALRRLDAETGELKRMWLLEAYHGQGIGYRLITNLIEFARDKGYAAYGCRPAHYRSVRWHFIEWSDFTRSPVTTMVLARSLWS